MMADWHILVDEVRPWVGTGGVLALCAWAGRQELARRKTKMEEAAAAQALKSAAKKDDQDGYGVLIATMQTAIDNMERKHSEEMTILRADHASALARIENEHRKCEERLSKIEGELMGFHRQALVASQTGVASLPASMMVQEAGKRAVEASKKG